MSQSYIEFRAAQAVLAGSVAYVCNQYPRNIEAWAILCAALALVRSDHEAT